MNGCVTGKLAKCRCLTNYRSNICALSKVGRITNFSLLFEASIPNKIE